MLRAWGHTEFIAMITEVDELEERPIWSAESPPVSRRELFRMLANQGQTMMARAMDKGESKAGRRPGRDRLRFQAAVAHMPAADSEPDLDIGDLGFAAISVNGDCTACGTCARACPTGALTFERSIAGKQFSLSFSAQDCIDCGACSTVCAVAAIEVNHNPSFSQVFGQESSLLFEGSLVECEQCGALIAERLGKSLCPVCDYRRNHPFGSMMPPGLRRTRDRASKEVDS
jgi:ferredoxin